MGKIIFRSLKIFTSIFLFLWIVPSTSHAEVTSQVQLLDGTLIKAEIISFSKGIYKLRSKLLGVLLISEEKIQSIRSNQSEGLGSSKTSSAESSPKKLKIQGLQEKLTSDPKTMKMLMNLQNDPSMIEVLNDEDLLRAIQQGNLFTVIKDKRIQKLMKNKSVGDIINRNMKK
jgi:hypothetical protein